MNAQNFNILRTYEYTLKVFQKEQPNDELLLDILNNMLGNSTIYKFLKTLILGHIGVEASLEQTKDFFSEIIQRGYRLLNDNSLTPEILNLLTLFAVQDNKLNNGDAKLFLAEINEILEKYSSEENITSDEIKYIILSLKYKKVSLYLRLLRTEGAVIEDIQNLINGLKQTEEWYMDYTTNLTTNYGAQ